MSTPQGAAEALRKIHSLVEYPGQLPYERCLAIGEINEALKKYAEAFPRIIDAAYNEHARLRNWYPLPFSHNLKPCPHVTALQYLLMKNAEVVKNLPGYELLKSVAQEAKVLFKVSIRPDGASVTCDFLQETGEVELILA